MRSDTLIVVAAVNDSFDHHLPLFKGGDVLRKDTSAGGHPTKAFIDAYRDTGYSSYLFLQDSLKPRVDDCVQPFRDLGVPVVAWGVFPLQWDSPEQARWVRQQYPEGDPEFGIFGPIFYAERSALDTLDRKGLMPEIPPDRHMAQGTERAWGYSFHHAGIPVGTLGHHDNHVMSSGEYPVFTKTFAGRP